MKTFLSLLYFNLLILSSFSQTITVDEMIEISKCKNFTCFNNFISQRGFSLSEIDTSTLDVTTYTYLSDGFTDTLSNGFVFRNACQFILEKGIFWDYSVTITFFTIGKKTYQDFLSGLNNHQFKVVDERVLPKQDSGNKVITKYESELYNDIKNTIKITSSVTPENDNGIFYTSYQFVLERYW